EMRAKPERRASGEKTDPRHESPRIARVEVEATTVEVDRGLEVALVAETAGVPLDGHDLAVEPFGDPLRDPVLAVRDDVVNVVAEHLRHAPHGLEARASRPSVPAVEEVSGPPGTPVLPQVTQRLRDRPGASDFQVQLLQR